MKRIIVAGLGLALIIGMIFGFTVITEFTHPDAVDKPKDGVGDKKLVGQPLLFNSSACQYDPNSENLQNRMFRGFYESGETDSALFWFRNRSPRPVTITSHGATCTTCSAARIAHVAPELLTEYSRGMAVAGVVNSLLPNGPDFFAMLSALQFDSKIPWQTIHLDQRGSTLTLPAGGTPEKPGLGLVQLQLKASPTGSQTPAVMFTAGVDDEPPTKYDLKLAFLYVGSFAVLAKTFDVGELAAGVPPPKFDLVMWSSTRDFGERFPPPAVRAAKDDPYVAIGAAIPMTKEEMEKLNVSLSAESKSPQRILAGYRNPITILREVNGAVAAIGPFSKEIFVANIAGDKITVTVNGSVSGAIRLEEGKEVNFGSYEAKYERTKKVTLVSDKPDLDIKIVEGETTPRFLSATLDPPKLDGGAKTWKLNLKVAANQGFQANWDGVVVLTSTGPNPITIRVPIKGNGTRR